MNILVTGAKGMVGTALVANLKNIKENKNRTRPDLKIDEIYEYDRESTVEELDIVGIVEKASEQSDDYAEFFDSGDAGWKVWGIGVWQK